MSAFSNRRIVIPQNIWDRNWDVFLANQEEEERRIVHVQKRLTELLRGLPTEPATAERVAWMTFWTRSLTASQATLAALQDDSEYMVAILQRVSWEMVIQIHLIMEPLVQRRFNTSNPAWREIMARLRAYTAWCLWGDRRLLREMTHPNTMESAWDTTLARRILSDPILRKLAEQLHWGAVEVYEAAREGNRQEAERTRSVQLGSIEELLRDRSLEKWVRKLRAHSRPKSFFQMFDENDKTMCRRLQKIGLRFAYLIYMEGSMAMHGDSLDIFLQKLNDGSWFPRIGPFDKKWRKIAMCIAHDFETVSVFLELARPHVWCTQNIAA